MRESKSWIERSACPSRMKSRTRSATVAGDSSMASTRSWYSFMAMPHARCRRLFSPCLCTHDLGSPLMAVARRVTVR